jgi:ABC-type histidine transport system ATPase subunit
VRAKTVRVDRWEKTPARTAQDKIKRRTPAGSSLAGVLLFCTNLTQPTGNLDSVTAGEIINILKTLAKERNKCVIVVTHSKEAADSADIILELSGKKLKKVK